MIKKKAVLITFDIRSEKFESDYERNKFFRGLHGWTQIIRKKEKRYLYRREGLLNEIPHIKVADSAFIVAINHVEELLRYFKKWSDKVHCEMLKIMLDEREWKRFKEKET